MGKLNLKRQVVVIGGGETFDTYEDYLKFLREDLRYDPYKFRKKNWKENLQKDLGPRFEVLTPSMPNKLNAKYLEWSIYFELHVVPHLQDGAILVGHSLGGAFLLKFLGENKVPFTVGGLMLVAAPLTVEECNYKGFADFPLALTWQYDINPTTAHVFHSTDDEIVPADKSCMMFPDDSGTFHKFTDRGHFIHDRHFRELVRVIKAL